MLVACGSLISPMEPRSCNTIAQPFWGGARATILMLPFRISAIHFVTLYPGAMLPTLLWNFIIPAQTKYSHGSRLSHTCMYIKKNHFGPSPSDIKRFEVPVRTVCRLPEPDCVGWFKLKLYQYWILKVTSPRRFLLALVFWREKSTGSTLSARTIVLVLCCIVPLCSALKWKYSG